MKWNEYLPNQQRSIALWNTAIVHQLSKPLDEEEQISNFVKDNSKFLGEQIFDLFQRIGTMNTSKRQVSTLIHKNCKTLLLPFVLKKLYQTKNDK